MTVSVVVPVHGTAPYLEHTLLSVVAQTLQPEQFFIVLDRADPTVRDRAARVAPTAQLLDSAGVGPCSARNTGLALVNTEYVAFLDSDDVWLPDFLEFHVAALASDSECAVSCSALVQFDAQGTCVLRPRRRSFQRGNALRSILVELLLGPSSALVRTSVAREVGGWPVHRQQFEDRAFFASIANRAPFVFSNQPRCLYRVHEWSRSQVGQTGWLAALREVTSDALAQVADGPAKRDLARDINAHLLLTEGWWYRRAGTRVHAIRCAFRAALVRPRWPEPYMLAARSLLPDLVARMLRNRVDASEISGEARQLAARVRYPVVAPDAVGDQAP